MNLFKTNETSKSINFDAFKNISNVEGGSILGGCQVDPCDMPGIPDFPFPKPTTGPTYPSDGSDN